jgi:hypothetical protein
MFTWRAKSIRITSVRITSVRISEIVLKKTSGKTKNKVEVRRPKGHIRDHRNKRMEETSRRQKRMEASFEEGQGSERAAAP